MIANALEFIADIIREYISALFIYRSNKLRESVLLARSMYLRNMRLALLEHSAK